MHLTTIGRIIHIGETNPPFPILSKLFRMPVPDIPVESNLEQRDGEHFLRLRIRTIHLAAEADGDLIN